MAACLLVAWPAWGAPAAAKAGGKAPRKPLATAGATTLEERDGKRAALKEAEPVASGVRGVSGLARAERMECDCRASGMAEGMKIAGVEAVGGMAGQKSVEASGRVAGMAESGAERNVVVAARLDEAAGMVEPEAVVRLGLAASDRKITAAGKLTPAGGLSVAAVGGMAHSWGVGDDVAFMAERQVWRGGPLWEIAARAMEEKRRGDMAAYSNGVARYWAEYRLIMERRRLLGENEEAAGTGRRPGVR